MVCLEAAGMFVGGDDETSGSYMVLYILLRHGHMIFKVWSCDICD